MVIIRKVALVTQNIIFTPKKKYVLTVTVYLCVCVCVRAPACMYSTPQQQHGSQRVTCGSQDPRSNSDHHAWQQAPLLTEPYCQPTSTLKKKK